MTLFKVVWQVSYNLWCNAPCAWKSKLLSEKNIYPVLGFEHTTSWTRVSSHNHTHPTDNIFYGPCTASFYFRPFSNTMTNTFSTKFDYKSVNGVLGIRTRDCRRIHWAVANVTRFGEFSPLWQNAKSIWLLFEGFSFVFVKILTLLGKFLMLMGKFTML